MNKIQFRKWLEKQKPYAFVGKAGCIGICPIANWLKETRGGTWLVGSDKYWKVNGDGEQELPTWAARFVSAVDNLANPLISARTALELINA